MPRLHPAITLILAALVLAPAGLAFAADDPAPDPSKVMIFIESSPKFPGAQKKAGGPLERLAGITPQTAKQHLAFAMNRKSNFDIHERDGFHTKVVSDMTGEQAMKAAEEHGVGSILMLTILRRAVKDIGQSEMTIEVDASFHIKTDKSRPWAKKYGKRLKAESQGFEGNQRIHDIDIIARSAETIVREMLFRHVLPHRVRSADLRGNPRTITAQVTNHSGRTVVGLDLEVPHSGDETFVIAASTEIKPGDQAEVVFALENDDPTSRVVWSKGELINVRLRDGDESGQQAGPVADDGKRKTLKERLEELRRRREQQRRSSKNRD